MRPSDFGSLVVFGAAPHALTRVADGGSLKGVGHVDFEDQPCSNPGPLLEPCDFWASVSSPVAWDNGAGFIGVFYRLGRSHHILETAPVWRSLCVYR